MAYDQQDEIEAFERSELIDPKGMAQILKVSNHSNIHSYVEVYYGQSKKLPTTSALPKSKEDIFLDQKNESQGYNIIIIHGYRDNFKINPSFKQVIRFRK